MNGHIILDFSYFSLVIIGFVDNTEISELLSPAKLKEGVFRRGLI